MTGINNGLWKAADVLDARGFVKGNIGADEGFCALGAFREQAKGDATGKGTPEVVRWIKGDAERKAQISVTANVIKELFPDRVEHYNSDSDVVVRFNDHTATTKEDVKKVFRIAAVKYATS